MGAVAGVAAFAAAVTAASAGLAAAGAADCAWAGVPKAAMKASATSFSNMAILLTLIEVLLDRFG